VRVLVTGATGLLGPHLCNRLIQEGNELTVFRRRTSNVTGLAGLSLRHEIGDITNFEDVKRATADQDVVIHAAAHTAYWGANVDEQQCVNVEGTRNVARACLEGSVKRMVHVSSIAAVGVSSDPRRPADESFEFNLEGSGMSYHISKRRAEEVILKAAAEGLDAVVVNPALIWGPNGKEYRGTDVFEKPTRGRIIAHGPGGRCIVHVADVVDGILGALAHGRTGERYILGGDNVSFGELNREVCRQLGLARLLIPIPGVMAQCGNRIKRSLNQVLGQKPLPAYDRRFCNQFYSSTKAKSELGYNPRPFVSLVREATAYVGLNVIKPGGAAQIATS
jgi:dihydroflavonol-4-reductase